MRTSDVLAHGLFTLSTLLLLLSSRQSTVSAKSTVFVVGSRVLDQVAQSQYSSAVDDEAVEEGVAGGRSWATAELLTRCSDSRN